MKKLVSLLVCMTLVFAMLPAMVVNGATEGIFTYTVSNGQATITECDQSARGAITIPSQLGGVSVTSIGRCAFFNCTGITSITIPDSVTNIAHFAFQDCEHLSSIIIPASVTSIGNAIFYNCRSLRSIDIEETNPKYCSDDGVLFNKNKTTLVSYPTGRIVTSYAIPNGVKEIEDYAFGACYNLTNITLPNSMVSIGNYAFWECTSLTNIAIPNGVTSIWDNAFRDCTNLKSVSLPNSVIGIGEAAFSGCSSLTNIAIPNGVSVISSWTFYSCTNLTSITISSGVCDIGMGAFTFCNALKDVHYIGSKSRWEQINISDGNDDLTRATIHYNHTLAPKTEKEITARHRSDLVKNASITFPYTDEFFVEHNGYVYNHELARATLGLELSAFTPRGAKTEGERTANIRNVYEQLGFSLEEMLSINYDKPSEDSDDEAAYTIASKTLYDGSTLVAVVVRGGGYGGEWRSNFHVGSGAIHTGFGTPANDIYSHLEEYLSYHNIDPSNTKIWITGFSRGAAIANIVAGKINENQLINRDNLYAYLFAVPSAVRVADVDAHNSMHDNIYNIVLPYDVVPKVVMSDWGFGRYGKTLMVKNRNNPVAPAGRSNYKRYYHTNRDKTVENYFKNLTNQEYSVGTNQTEAGDTAIKALIKMAKSQTGYVTTYQGAIMDIVEGIMCHDDLEKYCDSKYNGNEKYRRARDYARNQCFKLVTDLSRYGISIPDSFCWDMLYPIGIMMYMNGIQDGFYSFLSENKAMIADLISIIGSIGTVATAHNPEYYISWLYAYDDVKDIYDSGTYNKLMVACPVDVNIYNEEGEQVVSIINNDVKIAQLPVVLIGESAEVYLEGDAEDYTIQISAYDEGTVNYSVTEYEEFEEIRKINYNDIPVKTDDVLTGNVPQGQGNHAENYELTKNSEEKISYTEELSGEELVTLSVTVTTEGDGTGIGVDQATKGELVTLTAIPSFDAEFTGWYDEEGQFLSQEEYYSFVITESANVVAQFTDSIRTNLTELPTVSDGILTVPNQIVAGKNINGISYIGIYNEEDKLLAVKGTDITLDSADHAENTINFDLNGMMGIPAYLKLFLWDTQMSPLTLSNKIPIFMNEQ